MSRKGSMNVHNIHIDGRRTSITMSDIQIVAAKKLATIKGVSLNTYVVEKIKNKNDKKGCSQAVRDGIIEDLINSNDKEKNIGEFVEQKMQIIHYRKLLSTIKRTIRLAMEMSYPVAVHFEKVWKDIEDNGIKDCFDSGREYEKYIKKGGENDKRIY